MRKSPVMRDLKKFVSRPAIKQVIMGLTLMVPSLAFMARVPEFGIGTGSNILQSEERNRADIVASAWAELVTPTPVDDAVQALADEFNVPVTMAEDIHAAAVTESIDPHMAFGLVRAESRFRPTIVSPVGAVGLTQVMPATAQWLVPGTSNSDLRDPETNLKVGFKYLRSLINQFEGNEKLALTAYNRGPGTVEKILGKGGDPDNGYAEMVMTGKSAKHVRLMNAKFGAKHTTSKPKAKLKSKPKLTAKSKRFKASSVRRKKSLTASRPAR